MKNEIFENMLSRYDLTTEQHKRNAIFEVNQQSRTKKRVKDIGFRKKRAGLSDKGINPTDPF